MSDAVHPAGQPVRSLLFVPADSTRKLERSLGSVADALIFDLEDAVAADRKAEGRACVAAFLAERRTTIGKPVYVRVNDLGTGLALDDLAAVMPFRPDGIVLPKSRGGDDVRTLGLYLDAFEKAYPASGTRAPARIIAIATENATSVFGLASYKDASPRLWGLMWGAEDLSADLGAVASRDGNRWTPAFAHARTQCLLASAHAGVVAIDAVPTEIRNPVGLRAETTDAKRDGFGAKAAIHPDQAGVINQAFAPTDAEREWARRVMTAFEAGQGVATLDGRMLDFPHLRLARRLLA